MTMQDGFNFAVGAFSGVGVCLIVGSVLLALSSAVLRIINKALKRPIESKEKA